MGEAEGVELAELVAAVGRLWRGPPARLEALLWAGNAPRPLGEGAAPVLLHQRRISGASGSCG